MHLYPVSPSEMTPPSPPLDGFPKIHLNLGAQASLMVKTEEGDKERKDDTLSCWPTNHTKI